MSNQFILTPFFLDQPMPGLESLAEPGWVMNKPALPNGDALRRMSALHQPIADFVSGSITSGNRPVSIAGDCLTAIGVLAGLQHAASLRNASSDPVLIWFDAHGDFNTWETTPSGFLGGMPLAMLVGRGEQTLVNAVGLHPLPENQVILVGGRDLDPEEKQALEGSGVHHLTDIGSLLNHPLLARPLYIHLDTDILDPQEAPAMNYLAPGGPSGAGLQALFRSLARTGKIMAVSLSSWNPGLDGDGRSQAVCMALLRTLIEQ
jgi:arginase